MDTEIIIIIIIVVVAIVYYLYTSGYFTKWFGSTVSKFKQFQIEKLELKHKNLIEEELNKKNEEIKRIKNL